jgi:hypothetical protein
MSTPSSQLYCPLPPPLPERRNRPAATAPRLPLTKLIHRYLTEHRRALEIYEAFCAELSRERPGIELPAYNSFLAHIQDKKGGFLLCDFPAFCRALKSERVDVQPLIAAFLAECDQVPATDGLIIPEVLDLITEMGKIADHAAAGPLKSMTNSEIDDLVRHAGRVHLLCRQIQAEALLARSN